jgi:SAM-dependent methyltransferase
VQLRIKRVGALVVAVVVLLAATLPIWKPAAKRFKWFVIATNVYQDTLRRVGLRRDQISQPDYAALSEAEVPAYLERIDRTFNDYVTYAHESGGTLRDARVLEVGPGETLGVALRFLGAGAAHVVAVDKFVPLQTSRFHQRLYQSLIHRLPADEQRNAADAVSLDDRIRFNPKRLTYISGLGMEEAGESLEKHSFDLIVSNAVLEEVYDLDRMLATLDRLLRPGGRQVHVVDLRDYGMFSKYGFHPLEFLTVPDAVYRYMVEASGQPNRRLVNYYRDTMARFGYRTDVFRTWVVGARARLPEYRTDLLLGRDYSQENLELVRSIRPRMLARYRTLSDDDLLTASILLVAEKPAPTTAALQMRAAQ